MNPYLELKKIADEQYSSIEKFGYPSRDFHQRIVDLLLKNGITLRKKDGSKPRVTFSIPTSKKGYFVVGVRYLKLNGSKTEDHFSFQKGKKIVEKYYKANLEENFPEYKGAHKLQR